MTSQAGKRSRPCEKSKGELAADVVESTRQERSLAHPLLDRTEGMFDGLPATVHHLGSSGEAIRRPIHRGFVLVADDPSVGSLAYLTNRLGVSVEAEDFMCYLAAVLSHPGFTSRLRRT